MKIPSYLIIQLHTVLAGFFCPIAILFAITGGLYTFSIRGHYLPHSQKMELVLENTNLDSLAEVSKGIILNELKKPLPTGNYALKKSGTSWQFEWTGSKADFTLEPTLTPGEFHIQYKETSWHRFFVQLHKAKGGMPFKILAGFFSVALLLLFLSGVFIAFSRPPLKKLLYISLFCGVITAVLFMNIS